jgi:hypothetical protein
MSWYTWVFDGLGTTVLIGSGTALYRKYLAMRPQRPPVLTISADQPAIVIASPPERASTEPTPIQISEEIEAVLPFDREHAKDKYIGLNVLWKVVFAAVKCLDDKSIEDGAVVDAQRWYFMCYFGETPYYMVTFNLKTVPPEFKVLRKGSMMWVQGRIRSVESMSINLEVEPAQLEIASR